MSDDAYRLTRRQHLGIAWRGLWPILTIGLLLIAFAIWKDARFPTQWAPRSTKATPEQIDLIKSGSIPNPAGWIDWCILFAIAYFLAFKANVMARRFQVRPFDYLAASLITINAVFALLYLLTLAAGLFPVWVAVHPHAVLLIANSLRAALVVTLVCSSALLLAIPEPDRVRWSWVHARLGPFLVVCSVCLVALAVWTD